MGFTSSAGMRCTSQSGCGEGPAVGCGVSPGHEPLPDIGSVEAAALDDRFGQGDRHLGVVGELARRPSEVTSADELPDSAEDGCGESFAVRHRRAEFEWRSKRIGNGSTDDSADDSLEGDGVERCGCCGYFNSFWVRSGVCVGSIHGVAFPSGGDTVNAQTTRMFVQCSCMSGAVVCPVQLYVRCSCVSGSET